MHILNDNKDLIKMLAPNQHQEPPGESRIDKMRKFLSSPLTRKKPSVVQFKTFGTPLDALLQRSPSEHSVPFIITRLCQYILKTGLTHEGLFRISGNARSVERLKTSFDRTGDAPLETEGDVPSAAALLKLFLRELPDPIIPLTMHGQFLDAVKDKDKTESVALLAELVEILPPVNYSILNYLFSFLGKVSDMEDQNRMSASSLGIVFGPNLFRVTEDFVGLKEQSLTNQIVTYFISEHDKIFRKESESFTFNTCFSSDIGKSHQQVAAMVSSWPEAKSSCTSMLSTWSLGPLSAQHEQTEEFLTLNTLSQSMMQTDTGGFISLKCQDHAFTADNDLRNPVKDFSELSLRTSEGSSTQENTATTPGPKGSMERKSSLGKESLKEYYIMEEEPLLSHSSLSDRMAAFSISSSSAHGKDRSTSTIDYFHTVNRRGSQTKDSLENHEGVHTSLHQPKISIEKTEEMLKDTHKVYPRGRRRHIRHRKNRTEEKERRSHSELRTNTHMEIEDEFNGNSSGTLSLHDKTDLQYNSTGSLDETGIDARHSWPAFRKCREDEDIALSPLPQQLGLNVCGEASVSPSAFRSYLSYRNLHLDPNLPPSPPVEQEDIVIGGALEASTSTAKQLTRRVHSLKKKIKSFEENFEKLYGYKPSHAEKCSNITIKKMLTELNKARQDLKELKEDPVLWDTEETTPTKSRGTNTRSSQGLFSLSKNCSGNLSIEDTVKNSIAYLAKHRDETNRPENLEEMKGDQLTAEKVDIQKILLNFESMHGRPTSKVHRELVKPLYERYRATKRLIARNAPSKDNADLMPILEHETMDFRKEDQAKNANVDAVASIETKTDKKFDVDENDQKASLSSHINFHELSLSELETEVSLVRDEKRRLRKLLREFEEQFKKEHGRKVQREDKRAMESCYTEYKNAKAKHKLLEALVAKYEQTS